MRTRRRRRTRRLLALCLGCLVLYTAAEGQERRDPATVVLATDLHASPEIGAPVVAALAAGEKVSVLELRGDRARVEARGREGWVPLAKLRLGSSVDSSGGAGGGEASGGSSWLRGLTGFLGGGSGGGDGAMVPIGVRGLQREDVADARPDPAAVERLEAWRASPEDGLAYARGAGLQSRDVDYREAP